MLLDRTLEIPNVQIQVRLMNPLHLTRDTTGPWMKEFPNVHKLAVFCTARKRKFPSSLNPLIERKPDFQVNCRGKFVSKVHHPSLACSSIFFILAAWIVWVTTFFSDLIRRNVTRTDDDLTWFLYLLCVGMNACWLSMDYGKKMSKWQQQCQ